ncbi:MAG: hypothetical protein NTY35_11345 [Planctomycetota bacterium]|nr:hypothetical protein [Planctomycetota bacterium]
MPIRRPNLLDAFRRAHDVPAPPAGGAGSGAARAPGAGPEAPAARPPAPAAASEPPTTVAARGAVRPAVAAPRPPVDPPAATRIAPPAAPPSAPRRERLLFLALALTIATLVLVLMMRGDRSAATGAPTVQAANVAAAPEAPKPAPAPAATTPEVARAPHDAALYDARNRYTVRLIQYPNDKQGLTLATEAYRWLVKFGYPVGSPILLANGRGIVLCASAKPTQEELVPLRDNLRRLRYPESSKTMPFSDAYIDEIDDVLAR